MQRTKSIRDAPLDVIGGAWQRSVVRADGSIDIRAYTFCTLARLATAIQHRDVFTQRSRRYVDPRANLSREGEWKSIRPVVCRSLGWSPQPEPVLEALTNELQRTYCEVAQRLPKNPDVRFEIVDGKKELMVSPLENLEEPASLVELRAAVAARLPRLDLPEIVMEIAARTGFAEMFTHLTERNDGPLGLCKRRAPGLYSPGRPVENGYIESFNGKLRDEFLNVEVCFTLADARRKLHGWRRPNAGRVRSDVQRRKSRR